MSAGRIVLWRHGQTDYNVQMRVQGQVDIPLNQIGLQQAQKAAQQLRNIDIARIVCSPLERARQTALALGNLIDVEPHTDDRLLERAFGSFEGYTHQMMLEEYPQWYKQWRETGECAEAGIESVITMAERMAQAILEHADLLGKDETLVVVSHGSALSRATVKLLGMDPEESAWLRGLDNCSWTVLVAGRNTPWRLAGHNQNAWPAADALPSQA